MSIELTQLTVVEVRHFQRLDVTEVSKPYVLRAGVLLRQCLFVEGDIVEQSIGDVRCSQQAEKGNKGDRYGVKGRVEDGQFGWGGHHSPGGKDERAELVEGHTKL